MKNRYLYLITFLGLDVIASAIALVIANAIAEKPFPPEHQFSYIIFPLIVCLSLYTFKVYNILWEYANYSEILHIVPAAIMSVGILFLAQAAAVGVTMNYTAYLILAFLVVVFVYIIRLTYKHIVFKLQKEIDIKDGKTKSLIIGNIMLIGAGSAGGMIINEFAVKSEYSKASIKCVIDDNPFLKGKYISGVKIVGDRNFIPEAAEKYNIDYIIFNIQNCDNKNRTEILNICQKTKCKLKIIPSICRMYSEDELSNLSSKIRNVEIEDLLEREVIDINNEITAEYLNGKVVLVTGGGGSIGSELCRQIAAHNPKQLIIFDIYENNAYDIQNEIKFKFPDLNVVTLIGSVRDSKRMDYVFAPISLSWFSTRRRISMCL